MSIDIELREFVDLHIKTNATKLRNIEIITYYYGFGDAVWPTLEETAYEFGVGTRERVRQLLNKNFRDSVKLSDIPSINRFIDLLSSKNHWTVSELEKEIDVHKITTDKFSVKGLFNLISDLSIDNEFEIYTPDLKRASRHIIELYENNFIIKKSDINQNRKYLDKALKVPGRCGIANLEYLKTDLSNSYELISELISNTENAWVKIIEGQFWYILENRSNTLINYSEKIFSVIEACDAKQLASSYRNALFGRTNKYRYPPESIIQEYLESSIYLINDKGNVIFTGKTTELNEIEKELFIFLKDSGEMKYPETTSHLQKKGYGSAHIVKAVTSSPLVFINKTAGRGNYTYSLIGSLQSEPSISLENDRYRKFLLRLRTLLDKGTDATVTNNARKEQNILRDWLFKDKVQEKCAICNKNYSVKTLVTAHKKKRADCNDAERLDPNIVMPLCEMGCDYLYENMYVFIKDGVITKGTIPSNFSDEVELIDNLIGQKIDKKWLQGNLSYFRSPKN